MSVRKLASAIQSRFENLRAKFTKTPKTFLRTLAFLGTAATANIGLAQVAETDLHGQPLPFQDPFAFDPDFQWFEPLYQADIEDMKPKQRANYGWYGAYDRMSLWVSRSDDAPGEHLLDRSWGNRYDLGFMTEEDSGWSSTLFTVDGPNAYDTVRTYRLNLRNDTEQVVVLGRGGTGTPRYSIFPQFIRNTPGENERFVDIDNSENVANFTSFELNKTFRLEPYHYGGILEPLVGFRYMKFQDTWQQMNYSHGFLFDPYGNALDGYGEQITIQRSIADNQMLGGQLGFRYFKAKNRFRYSGEMRVFTMANLQTNTFYTESETQIYDNTTAGVPPVIADGDVPLRANYSKTPNQYGRNQEFVVGFDVRSELTYQLSRMFEIRGGLQIIDLGRGIWRGRLNAQNPLNDQQVTMAGFTFGIALNR